MNRTARLALTSSGLLAGAFLVGCGAHEAPRAVSPASDATTTTTAATATTTTTAATERSVATCSLEWLARTPKRDHVLLGAIPAPAAMTPGNMKRAMDDVCRLGAGKPVRVLQVVTNGTNVFAVYRRNSGAGAFLSPEEEQAARDLLTSSARL